LIDWTLSMSGIISVKIQFVLLLSTTSLASDKNKSIILFQSLIPTKIQKLVYFEKKKSMALVITPTKSCRRNFS